jgi:Cu-Zn family superoxide dismutase
MRAVAELRGNGVRGRVTLTQHGALALIECELDGVPDGAHGLHVHEFGDQTRGCESMGAHWSLRSARHGGRSSADSSARHTGDLGNVISRRGRVRQRFWAALPVAQALGRGLVLHADRDDLGRGGHEDSATTGHSGARLACGIIALAKAPSPKSKRR